MDLEKYPNAFLFLLTASGTPKGADQQRTKQKGRKYFVF